ncbi:hypothetical protein ASE00_07695 [Sphingomonas sp. Root710]|uniref:hypothetical protein n=1 Tax=Sphingomonas sp. Root710 TaxID=1736594 RepID=UPI0006FFE1CF|nr:hypothetical protein [Sphingomonas sp. Root710]KRB86563.1 hypothetical protein ASE00_07695 [Sphingomonas sp. Root710]
MTGRSNSGERTGGLSHHPAPHADKLAAPLTAFILMAGPLAWLTQLTAGFAMTSWACFPGDIRWAEPKPGYPLAAVGVSIICALIAAASGLVAWRKFAEVKQEMSGGTRHLADIGHGRTRFVALWGVILGATFTVTILVTLVAFVLVPPCAG